MLYAGECLASSGFRVLGFGLANGRQEGIRVCDHVDEALSAADFVLFPVPMSRDKKTLWAPSLACDLEIEEILDKAPSHARMFGANTSGFSDARLSDYGERADFAQENAVPTAEGALLLAMQKMSCTVNGARVGVIGFGRVGKATAALFRAAGARVTIFARRSEVCALASMLGYCSAPLEELCTRAEDFGCLVNTVPSPVIGCDTLCAMRRDALVLELASEPYGVDFEAARTFGVRTVLARGLPGKYSPETAGRIIAKTVLTMLCEAGVSF